MKIAVLGAGLTGLELGRNLKELGKDFVILEKEPQIGGLCRTNKTGRFHWDFAVHAMYSRNKTVTDHFRSLPLDYEYLNRNVKIFHRDKFILDYPFEIGIKNLPLLDKLECIGSYLAAHMKDAKQYSNLEDLIYQHFGKGIAKHFMVPYNNKIWNCKLSEISYELVSLRIDPPPFIDFILSVLGKNVSARTYQEKFIYPKKGIQELINYTAKGIEDNILLNWDVEKLVKNNGIWTIISGSGMRIEADTVISTIPLVEILKKIDIEGVKKEYNLFKWNNTFFVMIGLKNGYNFNVIGDCHWVFFKEKEVFYRTTLMHNFSAEFAPALVAEITQKGDILNKSEEEIKNLVIKDLIQKGIIGSINQIEAADIKLIQYTYPIPTVGLKEIKENIRNVLEKHNLFLLGRNGNWDYLNMDEVILNIQRFCARKFCA